MLHGPPGRDMTPRPGQAVVAVDGKAGPRFEWIVPGDPPGSAAPWRDGQQRGLTTSPDGKRVAYAGVRGGKYFVVIDGIERGPYGDVSRLTFSPDSRRFAFLMRDDPDGKQTPVVDGVPLPDLAGEAYNLCFSPDGTRFALAHRDTRDRKSVV